MSVNTGTVYAEIRIALDKLQGDVDKVHTALRSIGKKADDENKKIDDGAQKTTVKIINAFAKMAKGGIAQFAKMVSGISKTITSIPVIGWIIAIIALLGKLGGQVIKFVNETSQAYKDQQKELAAVDCWQVC